MHRRAVLSALAVALFGAAVPSRADDMALIRWSDIQLVDGRTLKAADLAGRPVVVEFWASWCPFCAKQNPFLEKLHREAGDSLRVLTFSIDRTEQAARDYLANHGYTFPAAMAGAQSEKWFGKRRGLPIVHVVDARGRIVFTEIGEMFEEDVAALMRFAQKTT
jgi:thiol-disulfide isomerase/thioredoxin